MPQDLSSPPVAAADATLIVASPTLTSTQVPNDGTLGGIAKHKIGVDVAKVIVGPDTHLVLRDNNESGTIRLDVQTGAGGPKASIPVDFHEDRLHFDGDVYCSVLTDAAGGAGGSAWIYLE